MNALAALHAPAGGERARRHLACGDSGPILIRF